jgi:DNA-binding MarR family transcriptional regulator
LCYRRIIMKDALSPLELPYACRTPGDQEMVDIALANGLSPRAAEAVAAIDAVMHKVRRSIQRRDFGRRVLEKLDGDLEVAHLDTISAIAHNPVWTDAAKEEVTVGLIAERLGIDPSRASRLSAEVVDRGYARRIASQADARRICLELTDKGEQLVKAVRRNKWELFAGALGQWNEQELVVFAALLDRFSGWATDNDGIERSAENLKRQLAEVK